MNNLLETAKAMQPQMIATRRHLHRHPEVGFDLVNTEKFVKERLQALGLEVKEYKCHGLSAVIEGNGRPGKTLLLRADMDALAMQELTGLEFQSEIEGRSHSCGHDLHTTMLLAAAEILVKRRQEFSGCIKLMFQPAEEILSGAKEMIKEGILTEPKVDAALALHTGLDEAPGSLGYNFGYMTTSSDNFKIDIKGKGSHGAYPHLGVDPINAGISIYQNFAQLLSRENPPTATTTLTLGQFNAGTNANVIPEMAVLQGTMRTYDPMVREKFKVRMQEICAGVAQVTHCQVDLNFLSGAPSVYSDPELTAEFVKILNAEMPEFKTLGETRIMASEDMAEVGQLVPTAYFMVNCKVGDNEFSHHNPEVQFDEDVMPYGVAILTNIAIKWLA